MASYKYLRNYKDDLNYPDKEKWISSRLLTLRHDLYEEIEKDRDPQSLIIGSWNIKAFDGGMLRMDESYHYIAEIIDHFDICAIQEIKSNLNPLERLVKLLGPNWTYFVSDVSTHKGGNNERMAFVYNKNRVRFKNLIGEIVVDDVQISRTPFFASFQAQWFKFSLCSAHIIYGADLDKRAEEIGAVAKALVKRAKVEDQVHIFLGDMNIESQDDVVMQALKESGLVIPEFSATNMNGDKFFDKIAFTDKGKATRKTQLVRSGTFDWRGAVYSKGSDGSDSSFNLEQKALGKSRLTLEDNLKHYKTIVDKLRKENNLKPYKNWEKSYKNWTINEMSDHLPIWVELKVDYSDDYLRKYL